MKTYRSLSPGRKKRNLLPIAASVRLHLKYFMEQSEEYKQLIKTLGQMHTTEILSALSASKTGYWSYQDFVNESVINKVESSLFEFISELEKYNTNRLIDKSM